MSKAQKKIQKVEDISSESESEEVETKKVPVKKAAAAKETKKPVKKEESSDEESVELIAKKTAPKEAVKPKEANGNGKSAKEIIKKAVAKKESSDEESEEEVKPAKKAVPVKKAPAKKESSDEESEEEVKPAKKAVPVKKAPAKKESSDEESEEEVVQKAKPATKAPAKKEESEEEESEEVVKTQPKKAEVKAEPVDTEVHSEIFVKNMSYQTTEDSLRSFFSKYGAIDSLKILTDRETGRSKGIGFVEFNTRAEAKKALADAANLNLDGRLLTVAFSNENRPTPGQRPQGGNQSFGAPRQDTSSTTVFVGNISFNSNEDSIKQLFSSCGNVVGVRLAKTPEGAPKGFCHVEFDSTESVTKAVALNGADLDGRNIRVDPAKPSGAGGNAGGRGGFGGGRGRGGFGGGRGRGGFGGGFGGNPEDKAKKSGGLLPSQGTKIAFDD